MECSACSHDNPPQARFCLECGQELARACASCREALPPTAKFCMHCGARQEDDAGAVVEATAEVDTAEQRLLTVLFCDLVESTRLSHELNPEEMRDVLREYQSIAVGVVQRHDGYIAQYLGDGILAYFGYPTAHEDDEERAVRAGLAVATEVARLATGGKRGTDARAEARVGIDTGRVVIGQVGAGGRHDHLAIGAIPNVAARLQAAAHPGQVIVGEATYRRARHMAEFEPVLVAAKGVGGALSAHRAVSLRSGAQRDASSDGLRSTLVGRADEMAALTAAINGACRGVGRVVTVVGEAGVGKSRLISEVRESIDPEAFTWLRGRCQDRSIPTHYGPFADILTGYCGIRDDDPPAKRRARVEDCVAGLVANGQLSDDRASECASLLARVLSIDLTDQEAERLAFADGAQIRHRTFGAIADVLIALTTWRPVVLELDDLHWADSASLDLIAHLSERAPSHPLAIVCVYRPHRGHGSERLPEIAAWKCPGRHVHIAVGELTAELGARLVASLLGVESAPAALREAVVDRGRGNPFYIEEALRSLVESDAIVRDGDGWAVAESLDHITVLDSVERIALSRFDRLSPDARRLLQVAAVVGTSFAQRVLEAVAPSGIDVSAVLRELEDAAFLTREYGAWDARYTFRYVYTQQVVYATILSRRRQELHAAIADAIAELYPDAAGEQAETLAYHYTHTEHGDRAIEHLMNAGAKARAAYLNDEAVECYRKALATLDGLPETAENVTQRVHVQEALGRIHHGAGNGDAAEGHLRAAIDLGQEAEVGANHLIRLCYWLGDVHWWKSEHARVVEVGEMAAALLGDERGTVEEALVNQTIAMGALFTGNKPVWRSRLERTAEFLRDLPYSEELRPSYVYIWGMRVAERDIAAASEWAAALLHVGTAHHDARATAQAHKGLGDMCWYLGDLAGALAKYETALAVFEEIGDTNHAGDCLIGLGALALAMGRLEDAKRYGGLGLAAAEQIDSAMFRAHSYLSVGELYVCLGDMSVGAHALSRSIELFAESGQRPSEPLVALGWGSLHEGDMDASAGYFHEAVSQSSRLMGSALSGLEQGYADNPDVFPLLCADLAASGSALPSGQWCLEAASPSSFPAPVERMDFIAIRPGGGLGAEWEWDDLHGDGAYAVENVLEIRAPNGRDLSKANVSAPRLLRPVEGDFAADAVSLPGRDDRPTLGGLLLWVDADNFLRVERGIRGHRDVSLRGRVDGADKLLGRGRLDADRIHLRVERRGGSVRALCSADGRAWHSIGETEFTSDPPARVGLHAIGVIERTIYRGAFREGAAIRFESFALRQ